MPGNEFYLKKADTVLADLTTNGGALVPKQAARFIRLAVKEAVVTKEANVPTMTNDKQRIETIRFGSRVLRPGTEAAALAAAQRSKPDFTKVEMSVVEIVAEVRYSYSAVESNIERGGFRTTVMQALSAAVGRDIDELVIQGDSASADDYLALFDGMLKTSATNVNAKAPIGTLIHQDFVDTLVIMPEEFQRDLNQLRFYTSVKAVHDYRAQLAGRVGAVGDKNLQSGGPLAPTGISLVGVPMFPKTKGAGSNETELLLTHPKNINVGFHRQITIETDRDISARQYIVVVSLRADFKYTHEPATVKTTGVL